MVVARWYRPLAELEVNDQLHIRATDDDLTWERPDGWQCFAPEAFYADGMPPVDEISREIDGGPVLGALILRSDFYRVSFMMDGRLRTIANGVTLDHPPGSARREMAAHWGHADWQRYAAVALQRWSRDFAAVPYIALWATMTIHQVFAERTVLDLLSLLGLVADPSRKPWWSGVPGAVYAIHAVDIEYVLRNAKPSRTSFTEPDRDPVFACTDTGVGVWSQVSSRWLVQPTMYLRPTLNQLVSHLIAEDWGRRSDREVS